MKHILHTQLFDPDFMEQIFAGANKIRELLLSDAGQIALGQVLPRQLMQVFFYEESTRTRVSFEDAGLTLGMKVITTTNAAQTSSVVKGETLEHSIRILCEFRSRVIVLRHKEEGAATRAALVADQYEGVHIINGGDGVGQHPTQAILDMFTIQKHLGQLNNFTILLGGDLQHGRTVHSLAYLLSKYSGVRIILVSPQEIRMKEGVLAHLTEENVSFREETDLRKALEEADVVYWTRIQEERFEDKLLAAQLQGRYTIGLGEMACMKKDAILMHPLPIKKEIAKEVDADPRAIYFKQAGYGIPVRMALLCHLLGKPIPSV